jgi:hypothetical protein
MRTRVRSWPFPSRISAVRSRATYSTPPIPPRRIAYFTVIHVTKASPRLRTPTREANTRLWAGLNVRPAPPVTPLNRELGLATVNTHQSAIPRNQPVDSSRGADGISSDQSMSRF